ncbi:MAG: guanylate kinase [Flavobacterium sp.]|jgi:guanylate kinase
METGRLFVVAAPSGAGKTSLVKALTERNTDVSVSISHTTRKRRPDEKNGVNYYFVSQNAFSEIQRSGGFIESADVFGNAYGTSKKEADRILSSGKHLILEIDWQGAEQIRLRLPEAESIYILPPSISALRERLLGRGQDDNETIQKRMDEAISEVSHYSEFDHLIINEKFDLALQQFEEITLKNSKEYQLARQSAKYSDLLANLLRSKPV